MGVHSHQTKGNKVINSHKLLRKQLVIKPIFVSSKHPLVHSLVVQIEDYAYLHLPESDYFVQYLRRDELDPLVEPTQMIWGNRAGGLL